MDFIEGLPQLKLDKFSKYGHYFIPLSHPFTALTVAKTYMTNIYKLHGLPTASISDRDRVFTSHLWQQLFKMADTQLRMSTSYHPRTDGQTERVNQCLEAYLRCSVQGCPKQWSQRWSPFEVLYGHPPKHFGADSFETCAILICKSGCQRGRK
jgi:transposase InsO family protein